MDKAKASFDILVILMSIDGKIETPEMDVIKEFVESNVEGMSFDPKAEINTLIGNGINYQLNCFGEAAVSFLNDSDEEEREILLEYAFDMITSGGKVRIDEMRLMLVLGGILGVDAEKIINSKMG